MKKVLLPVAVLLFLSNSMSIDCYAQHTNLFSLTAASLSTTNDEITYDVVSTLENGDVVNLNKDELGTGTLMYGKSIVLNGAWSMNELLEFRLALKSDGVTSTDNNYLELLDMSNVTITGYFIMADYLFYNCRALKNIILPSAGCSELISLNSLFFGCTSLETVENFEKFTNIYSMTSIFYNCVSLKEIRLGINPNSMSGNTINNAFGECNALKYLPEGISDIPQIWTTSGYGNFVLPFTIAECYPPQPVVHGEVITLPQLPITAPRHAAVKDYVWEYSKNGDFTDAEPYTDQIVLMSYTNAKLRCTMTDQMTPSNQQVSEPFAVTGVQKPLTAA